ncbi:MAG: dNTP triphosphohydrolase [Armatimonadota bacterium]|nr:dNTP triphosphohydrolase [Armatimonadota bacterium]
MARKRTDRHYGEQHQDQRSAFQRDRDRVLYSSALRRLAGVTQVVHTAEGHIFHNRLTHTLKVAQVARRLAEFILQKNPPNLIEAVGDIDPDVVETAALVHDLGHPPFGHIAEEELDKQLGNRGVQDGFEGNAQSFRVITQVTIKDDKYQGLNLTRASLNASLKYPWSRGVAGKTRRKWGHYYSERRDFQFARELGPGGENQSAEAAIMDWADDITYSVHDVDDFYRAGFIPLDRLMLGTSERDRFLDAVFQRWEKEKRSTVLNREAASAFFDGLKLLAVEAEDLEGGYTGSHLQQVILNHLSGFLIQRYILPSGDGVPAVTLVAPPKQPSIQVEPTRRAEVDLLKALMQYYVFHNPALTTQQFGQRRVIRELFDIYFDAADPNSKDHNLNLLPQPFRDRWSEIRNDELKRARLVADLISSMTEQQALLLHQRLTGIAAGSVRDPILG